MLDAIDVVEQARRLSEIASATSDVDTAVRLLELARELLASAGLGEILSDTDASR